MTDNWALSLSHVLRHEGGYADHPSDPGGITNLGVTKSAWEAHVGHPVEDMRALTVADVEPFYKRRYWNKLRCDDLPAGLDYAVFDLGVNSGVGRAARMLQQVSGAVVDGMIGKATLRLCAGRSLIDPLCDARMWFLRQLPTFGVFGKGWTKRVDDVRARAKQMEAE